MDDIIIVSGLPRSGTSMMMRILVAGGVPVVTDNIRKADIDNPKGYYELEQVKTIKQNSSWIKDTRGQAFKMVSMLLYYLPPEEHYKIVFMRRAMEEILASERKMLARRAKDFDPERENEVNKLFTRHLQDIGKWLDMQNNIEVLYVNYNMVLKNKENELEKLLHFLDRQLNLNKMLEVIDLSLYRQRYV